MWKSSPEIREVIQGLEDIELLIDLHALSTFWLYAVYPEGYRADDAWRRVLVLSSDGERIVNEFGGLLPDVPEPDLVLTLFGIFAYHDLLVDWKRSDLDAIATLLERELLSEKLRLPYRFGRVLYDRFNDVHHSSRTEHLLPEDTRKLLEGTSQGVYQLNRYVTGPLGVLQSEESRWISPSLVLPLWHCSDTGCIAFHEVSLIPPEVSVVQAYRALLEKMKIQYGPRSEWHPVLRWLHRGERWEAGRPYYDLPVVFADCVVGRERTNLLTCALSGRHGDLLRAVLSGPPRRKSDGSGPAVDVAERLSPEAQLQLIFLLPDKLLIDLLDTNIDSAILRVPPGEKRTSKIHPPGRGYRDSITEISSLGVRSTRENPTVRLCTEVWRAYERCGLMNELEWRVRADSALSVKEAVVAFIRDKGPVEAVNELVLSSGAVTQAVCANLGTSIAHAAPREPIAVERMLWKLGFDPMQFDDSIPRFQARLREFNERVLEISPVKTEDDREKIRSVGVNVFVSVEDFLERFVSYNVWLLASDHFLQTNYSFDLAKARRLIPAILGERLESGSTQVVWSPDGKNSLGVLFRYLSESVKWMDSLDGTSRDALLRPEEDLPHFASDQYHPFAFRHKQLWADSDINELRNYREGYRSVARLLEQANLTEMRNGLDHYRDGDKFPDGDALLACAARLQQALQLAEVHRYFPKTFWLHRWTKDRFGLIQYECVDYAGRPMYLYGPLLASGLPEPSDKWPMLIAPGNLLGMPQSTLVFQVRETNEYSAYWEGYPRKRRIPPAKSLISE